MLRSTVMVVVAFLALVTAAILVDEALGKGRAQDPRRDAYAAIRVVFPLEHRLGARCINRREVGRGHQSRFRHVYRWAVGRAGEVGWIQAHPGWWRTGWNGNRPALAEALVDATRRPVPGSVRLVAPPEEWVALAGVVAEHRSSVRAEMSKRVGNVPPTYSRVQEAWQRIAIANPTYLPEEQADPRFQHRLGARTICLTMRAGYG